MNMKRHLIAMALVFSSVPSFAAPTAAQLEAKKKADEERMAKVLEELLVKIGAARKLKFDLNFDTSLGFPLDDSHVSLQIPLLDKILIDMGGDKAPSEGSRNLGSKPRLSAGVAGQLIDVNARADRRASRNAAAANDRQQDTIVVTGDVAFTNPEALAIAVGVDKNPNSNAQFSAKVKARLRKLSFSTEVSAKAFEEQATDENGQSKVVLGADIRLDCEADVMTSSIKTGNQAPKEVFEALEICSFDAKFNPQTKKYDVKVRIKN